MSFLSKLFGGKAQESQSPQTPEVGRDIRWTDIIRQVFRVIEFDRAGTTVEAGNRVRPLSANAPLRISACPITYPQSTDRLPIVHRDDFLLAASVFDEPQFAALAKTDELLVTYVPKHRLPGGLAGLSHAPHYVLTSRGTLERYYSVNGGEHMGRPAPEKLFGSFVWAGDIRVGVNTNPSV
jgi:hypothetical protein